MKTILANVVPEETRLAMVNDTDGELEMVEFERASTAHLVGNIYRGQVQNVLPGMQAAFVDIGGEKNAFLYIGDGLPYGERRGNCPTRKSISARSCPCRL